VEDLEESDWSIPAALSAMPEAFSEACKKVSIFADFEKGSSTNLVRGGLGGVRLDRLRHLGGHIFAAAQWLDMLETYC
jgi:hypothetical protein